MIGARPGSSRSVRRGLPGALVLGLALGLVGVGVAAAPPALTAQPVEEVQVAVDPEGEVFEISPALRSALGLAPGVENFQVARLFRVSGSDYVLEVTRLDPQGRPVRTRSPLTAAEVEELRSRVARALASPEMQEERSAEVETGGRAGLILASTSLGLGYYGWAVPAVFDLEERGAVAAYLLTSGASFLLPWQATGGRSVTPGQRDAAVWGGTRGILVGLALADALTGGDEVDDRLGEGDEDAVVAGGMVASLAGGVLGYALADGAGSGQVAWTAAAGDFALTYGFGTALALGLYDDDVVCPDPDPRVCPDPDDTHRTPEGHLTALALAGVGTWAGHRWAGMRIRSVGQARALRAMGVAGAQVVAPLAWALFESDENEKALVASLMAGSAAGLYVGDRVLPGKRLSPSDGLLVMAGHLAGGLGGLGLTYLVDPGPENEEVLYLTASAVGSVAGAWLTLEAVADDAGPTGPEVEARGISVELRPLAGLLSSLPGLGLSPDRDARRPAPRPAPWLTLRF